MADNTKGLLILVGLLGTVLLIYFVAFHLYQWRLARTPNHARTLAGLTVACSVLTVSSLVFAVFTRSSWDGYYLLLLLAMMVSLATAAYQWTASWFRGLAMVFLVLGGLAIATVGLYERDVKAAVDQRSNVTSLDEQLMAKNKRLEEIREAWATAVKQVGTTPKDQLARHTKQAQELVAKLEAAQKRIEGACAASDGVLEPAQTGVDAAESCRRTGRPNTGYTAADALAMAEARQGLAGIGSALAAIAYADAQAMAKEARKLKERGGPASEQNPANALDESASSAVSSAEKDMEAAGKTLESADMAVLKLKSENEPAVTPEDLPDLLATGGQAAIGAVTGSRWSASPWLWIVLGVALLYGYRQLEVLNGGLEPGPVAFGEKDTEDADQEHGVVLRHHVLANLAEPGAQPGTKAIESISDLPSIDKAQSAFVKTLVSIVSAVSIPMRGYEIVASVIDTSKDKDKDKDKDKPEAGAPPVERSQADCHVLLVIRSRRTSRTLKTVNSQAKKAEDAIADAAYQAVGWILSNARAVPPWMRWVPNAGTAYSELQKLKGRGEAGSDERLEKMRELLRETPGSAEMMVRYGYELDLAGSEEEALAQYARAATMWGDYGLAQYRLAIARTVRQDYDGADKCFDIVERGLAFTTMVFRRLSIRERNDLVRLRDLGNARDAVEVARLVSRARRGDASYEPSERLRRSRSAIVQYNLACYYSVIARTSESRVEAVDRLEAAMTCSDAYKLSGKWMAVDSDLAWARGYRYSEQRMRRFIEMLPREEVTQ